MSFLRLIRFFNALFASVAVIIAYYITAREIHINAFILSFSAFFITGAGNAFNDIMDIEVDMENKPHRPLPSGKISLFPARFIVFWFNLLGLILAFYVSYYKGIIAIFAVFLLYLYNGIYKTHGFTGNLMVALNTSLLFLFGAYVFNEKIIFLMSLSFLLSIDREMLKDYEDREGDKWRYRKKYISFNILKKTEIIISLILLVILALFTLQGTFFYKFVFCPISVVLVFLQLYLSLTEKIILSVRVKKILMIFGILMAVFI